MDSETWSSICRAFTGPGNVTYDDHVKIVGGSNQGLTGVIVGYVDIDTFLVEVDVGPRRRVSRKHLEVVVQPPKALSTEAGA